MSGSFDPTQFINTLPTAGPAPQPLPAVDPVVWQEMDNIRSEGKMAQERFRIIGNELQVLQGIMKDQMSEEYAEARNRVEAELFPPQPSVDQQELAQLQSNMALVQSEAKGFQDDTKASLLELAKGVNAMTEYIEESREREVARADGLEHARAQMRANEEKPLISPGSLDAVPPEEELTVTCEGCMQELPGSDLLEHLGSCPEYKALTEAAD